MKVIVNGAGGRLGADVIKEVKAVGGEVIAVDMRGESSESVTYKSLAEVPTNADLIIDFSSHLATKELVDYAVKNALPMVVATTGQTEEEKALILEASKKVPIFFSANMSLGVALLLSLAKKTAVAMGDADIEIVETHHNRKVDAPSGTALMLANGIKEARENGEIVCGRNGMAKRNAGEIGISSVRLANVVGKHEILISNGTETITLTHEAHDKALFAKGAVKAGFWLVNHGAGLYNMNDLVKE